MIHRGYFVKITSSVERTTLMSKALHFDESTSLCGHRAQFVDVEGIRTRYYDVGRGHAMLLKSWVI
ncbi:MAG: hypothetical protein A2Z14_13360 [Chloroflexi bacterium RBG_16_48_8]|nr:MAG: hypothetical protein A2Z14_13360 [Chloroflexi bacterium RBG_16_48_8]